MWACVVTLGMKAQIVPSPAEALVCFLEAIARGRRDRWTSPQDCHTEDYLESAPDDRFDGWGSSPDPE